MTSSRQRFGSGALLILCSLFVGACSKVVSASVGGQMTGLIGSVVLQNNGGDDLTLTQNGPFSFPGKLDEGDSYQVTVLTPPAGQTCTITQGAGTIGHSSVTNISATCSDVTFLVGGTITGLVGTLVLQNNGADDLTLTADGPFTFATPVVDGGAYNVAVLTQPGQQVCTIAASSGTVSGGDVTGIVATCVTGFTIGGHIAGLTSFAVLQNNGGDDLVITQDGAFTFATLLASGGSYGVTVLSQPPGQTCTITLGGGTVANAEITTVAADCVDHYASMIYTSNSTTNDLTSLSVDGTTGVLNVLGLPVASLTDPSAIVVDPTRRFVYATNSVSGDVNTYSADTASGVLTATGNALAGNGPQDIVFDPTGRFAYALNVPDNSITMFDVNSTTGALSEFDTEVGTFASPTSIAVGPTGRFLYATGSTNDTIAVYDLNQVTGRLTLVNSAAMLSGLSDIEIGARGRYLYASSPLGISMFDVDPSSGALSGRLDVSIAGTPLGPFALDPTGRFGFVTSIPPALDQLRTFSISQVDGTVAFVSNLGLASSSSSVVIDPTGRFFYMTSAGVPGFVSTFSINQATGQVSSVGIPAMVGDDPSGVAATPLRRFVYVANEGAGTISTFMIDPTTGVLTKVGLDFVLGGSPRSVAVGTTGRFAYVADPNQGLRTLAIDPASGVLSLVSTPTLPHAEEFVVHPSGRFVYGFDLTGPTGGVVRHFSIDRASGIPNSTSTLIAVNVRSVIMDPLGRFLYATIGNNVRAYSINGLSGMLTDLGDANVGTVVESAAVDPSGRFVIVTDSATDIVSSFVITGSGALSGSSVTQVIGGDAPKLVAIDPTGRFAYVTNANSGDVSAFAIDLTTGGLTFVGSVTAGDTPDSISVDATGRFVYVANLNSADVTTFRIDHVTGGLTKVGTEVSSGATPSGLSVLGGSH